MTEPAVEGPVLGTRVPSGLTLPTAMPEPGEGAVEFTFPTLPATLPAWYAPGFYSEGNMRRRLDRLNRAGYSIPTTPDYGASLTSLSNELVERRLATGTTTALAVERRLKELSDQYPLASPDMLVAIAVSGGTPDPTVMAADQQEYLRAMSSLSTLGSATAGSAPTTAPMGVALDRTTKGIVTLPNGREYQVTPGDIIVRDPDGSILDIIGVQSYAEKQQAEGNAFPGLQALKFAAKAFFYSLSMPYEGLVGMARNVGQTLQDVGDGEANLPEALLDVLGYAPMVAAVREIVQGDSYINPWEQTYMGQMILAAARGERIDVGNGFFIAEDSDVFQRQLEAAAGAYSIDGQAFTFGRGVAGAFDMDPNTLAYRSLSGVVDFSSAIVLDPTVWAAGLGIPSRAIRGLTSVPAVAKGVRGARGLAGMEKGTGTIVIGVAKRSAAKAEAKMLRAATELEKAERTLARKKDEFASLTDDVAEREAYNAEIEAAQRRVEELRVEGTALVEERNAWQTLDEIEEAAKERVDLAVQAQVNESRNLLATRSPVLADLADETREAEARLSLMQEVVEGSGPLTARTGRAIEPGQTVPYNGRDWTVREVGDQVVIESPKGARRRLALDHPALRDMAVQAQEPLHTRQELRVALLNLRERTPPEDLSYQVDALEGLRDLPGDVTVRVPESGPQLGVSVGMLDGEGMVAAWAGEGTPQLVHAAEQVPDTVMERLWASLSEKVFSTQQAEWDRARRLLRKDGPTLPENLDAVERALRDSEALGDDLLRILAPTPAPAPALPTPDARIVGGRNVPDQEALSNVDALIDRQNIAMSKARERGDDLSGYERRMADLQRNRDRIARGLPEDNPATRAGYRSTNEWDTTFADYPDIGPQPPEWQMWADPDDLAARPSVGMLVFRGTDAAETTAATAGVHWTTRFKSAYSGRGRVYVARITPQSRYVEPDRPAMRAKTIDGGADPGEVRLVPGSEVETLGFYEMGEYGDELGQFVEMQRVTKVAQAPKGRGIDYAKYDAELASGAYKGARPSPEPDVRKVEADAPPWRPETSSISPVQYPTPTWGDLLDALNDRGLAPYLERILREDGFDGISGLISRQPLDTDGIWWGYSRGLASYKAKVGAVTADPNLRLRVNARSGQDDIALVLDDRGAAVGEFVRVQDELDSLRAQRQSLWDNMDRSIMDANQVRSAIQGLDRAIAQLQERWVRLSDSMGAIPNYTPQARAERVAFLQERIKGNLQERARLHSIRHREARVVESLQGRMTTLTAQMADHERVIEGLRLTAGASMDGAGRGAVDLDAASRFLFGGSVQGAVSKTGRMVIDAIADTTSASLLHSMTRWKLPDEVVQDLLRVTKMDAATAHTVGFLDEPLAARGFAGVEAATGRVVTALDEPSPAVINDVFRQWKRDQVREILARNIGVHIDRPIKRGDVLRAAGHPGPRRYRVSNRTHPYTKRMRQLVPSAVKIDLSSAKDTAMGLKSYMDQIGIDDVEQYRILDKLWDEPSELIDTQEIVSRNVLVDTFDMMAARMTESVGDLGLHQDQVTELTDMIRKATRVYLSGERDAALYWRNALGNTETPIRLKMTDGTSMPITGAQLESEMAHGVIFLPDPEAFRAVVRRAGKSMVGSVTRGKDRRGDVTKGMLDATNRLFSDYWRSFMLLRPAYVVRNLMEMQVRNFLSGHMNIVTNPVATIAMAIGPTVSPKGHLGKMMDSLAPYTHDVHGWRFGYKNLSDNPHQAELVERAHESYLEMIRMDRALNDLRTFTGVSPGRRGVPTLHGKDSLRFAEGWSEELLLLRGSPTARVLAGNTPPDIEEALKAHPDMREDILTAFIFKDDRAEEIREIFRAAGPEYQRMLRDRRALSDFLFGTDGNADSVEARLGAMTAYNDSLRRFVATGELLGPTGKPIRVEGRVLDVLPERHMDKAKAVQGALTRYYKNHPDVALPEGVRVWIPETVHDSRGAVDKFLDAFFRVTTRTERIGVMGPEWRYVYWDKVRELAPEMTRDARQRMLKHMEQTGLTLRSNGKPIPSIQKGYKVIRDTDAAGAFTVEDIHRIASDYANEAVRDLYYDAHKRNQFWHALRLVIPFGQAWADTWSTWVRLSAQNPVQFYKGMKAFQAGLEQGSNVIYEATDFVLPTGDTGWFESPEGSEEAPWYDPRQGFLFRDNYGAYTFNIPVLGHAMGALMNAAGPGSPIAPGALQSGMRVEGLNLLFGGGTMAPGLGPILQVPLAQALNRAEVGTGLGAVLYDWLYPVGEPDLSRSLFDQMLPAAVRRFTSVLFDRNSPFVMSNMAAATNFLLAQGDYNMMDRADRDRLMEDALGVAKRMGAVTAIGQFVLPTTPTRVWVGEQPDGDRVGLAAAAALYWDGYVSLYDDQTEAQLAFLDDFGEPFLSAFTGQTEGAVQVSESAWQMILAHPDFGKTYSEELTFLFPKGGPASLAWQWQQEVGQRRYKTVNEWHADFWAYMVRTRKARIEEKAIQTLQPDAITRADLAYVDQQVEAFTDAVAASGGYQVSFKQDSDLIESTYAMLQVAPPDVRNTPQAEAFLTLYAARDAVKQKAAEIGLDDESLSAKSLQPYLGSYLMTLEQARQAMPEMIPVIRRMKQEVEG